MDNHPALNSTAPLSRPAAGYAIVDCWPCPRTLREEIAPKHGAEARIALMERVKGIEPSSKAWEAFVLPLNYTRNT